MKKRYLIVTIVAAILIFSPLLLYFLSGRDKSKINDQTTLPTPTPVQTDSNRADKSIDIEDLDHNLAPTQNPEYIEKITKQPFWDLLPYWDPQGSFNIEYMDSADQIVITTFAKNQADKTRLEQLARNWLEKNGAIIKELDLQYNTTTD